MQFKILIIKRIIHIPNNYNELSHRYLFRVSVQREGMSGWKCVREECPVVNVCGYPRPLQT